MDDFVKHPCPSCGELKVANPANMCAGCYLAGKSVPTDRGRGEPWVSVDHTPEGEGFIIGKDGA